MPRVFLSYCREDIAEVSRLRDDLIALGIDVWWDKNLLPGQDWKHEIREAMKQSSAVILCLSAQSLERTRSYIYPEALDAISAYRQRRPGEIFLIPVRLSRCEIPSIEIDDTRTLDRLHQVDLFPANNWDSGIRKIVESIGQAAPRLSSRADSEDSSKLQHRLPVARLGGPRPSRKRHVVPHTVFLSYSSKDTAIAGEMSAALEENGIRCWIAPRDIVPGKRYAEQIVDAIDGSRAFVLIFSSNSNISEHVIREVEKAVRQKIPIIPFRIENISPTKDMDYLISICQWIDAWSPPLEEHFIRLAQTLQSILNGSPDSISVPPPHHRPKSWVMPVGVSLTVTALAVICLTTVVWLWPKEPTPQQSAPSSEKVAPGPTQKDPDITTRDKTPSQAPTPAVDHLVTPIASVTVSNPTPSNPVPKPKPIDSAPTPLPDKKEVSKEREALDHFQEGKQLLDNKKIEEALPELLLAVQSLHSVNENHPELAQAYRVLGDIYYQERDYLKAIKVYTQSIQRKDSGIARHARGLAYRENQQYDKALADFEQATHLDDGRGRADFHLDKAILLAFQRRFIEADLAHDRATHLDPRNPNAFYLWGRTSASAMDFRKAIWAYTEAINLEPRSDFYFYRAKSYCYLGIKNPVFGEYQKAIDDYSKAIFHGRKDAETYVARGDAYRSNSDYRLAIADYDEAIQLVQKGARSKAGEALKKQAYLGRADIYLRQLEIEKAYRDALMANSLDPQDPVASKLLQRALEQKSIRDSVR